MPVISKELFYKNIDKHVHCRNVHYWEPSCLKASFLSPYLVSNLIKGTGKFFLPIYLIKMLINYRKINDKKFIKSLIIAEGTSIVYGIFLGGTIVAAICFLRELFGRLHYYNLLLVPGIVSGLSLAIESEENQVLHTLVFFNSFVESILKNIHFSFFKITRTRETFLFMCVSSILMYCLENMNKKSNSVYFWFYTPPRRKNNEESDGKVCSHQNNCWKFCQEGFVKYFGLGYLVNVIKRLIPKMGLLTKQPQKLIRILFGKSNVKFGLFIGAYVATYRILTCYLLKWGKIRRKFHSLIAGLLSGVTYAISPNMQVLAVGITTFLQVLYANISVSLNIKNNFWPRQILFMICHGILLQNKMFFPKSCSVYYKNMIEACTNDVTAQIYERLISQYFPEIIKKQTF